jgi:hypothetical protein
MVTPTCACLCTGNFGVGVGVRVDIRNPGFFYDEMKSAETAIEIRPVRASFWGFFELLAILGDS